MPALPISYPLPPSEFITSASEKGFTFSVKPGGALGVKPPPGGSLTAPMRRYVIAMKPELLALLIPPVVDKGSEAKALTEPTEAPETPVKAPSVNYVKTTSRESESQVKAKSIGGELVKVGTLPSSVNIVKTQSIDSELVKVGQESAPRLKHIETVSRGELRQVGRESPLAEALYPAGDSRQEVLCWAVSEAKKGTLPELAEPLTLPSGNVVSPDHATAWLIAAESRSVGLRSHATAFPDCALALGIVQRDMKAIAMWARHARIWLDAPYTHQGEVCLLHDGALCLLPGAV